MTKDNLKPEPATDANTVLADSKKFAYTEAHSIALAVLELLRPHCIRIEIAGSLRREKPEVKDIEIVAIPKPYQTGLFQDGIAEVVSQWQKVKGELEYGKCKYTQRILPEGIKLDLFFAEEGNWGLIFAIRTGSADYSHKVLANGWVKRGYKSEGGYLTQGGKVYEVREEKDLFDRLGIQYVEPKHRTL
jgi:DNA polymerase/3'-5' exonuclease PolX